MHRLLCFLLFINDFRTMSELTEQPPVLSLPVNSSVHAFLLHGCDLEGSLAVVLHCTLVGLWCWLAIARLKCRWRNVIAGLSENMLYTLNFYISHILLPSLTRVVLFVKIEIIPQDSIKASDLTSDFSFGCLWISFFSQLSSCFLSYCPLGGEHCRGGETSKPSFIFSQTASQFPCCEILDKHHAAGLTSAFHNLCVIAALCSPCCSVFSCCSLKHGMRTLCYC